MTGTLTSPAGAEPTPATVADATGDRRRLRMAAREGLRDITPMVIGVAPFGLAIGATMATTSVPAAAGLFSGPAILAGAAQLMTITMLDEGAAPLMIVLSALIVNARILLYSASMAPWFRDEPLRRRLLLAIPVIDQMHFTCVPRFQQGDLDRRQRIAYYGAAGTFLIFGFVSTQVLALVAGARLPEWTGIGVAAPLALTGLLAKATTDRTATRVAAAAGVVAVVGAGLPFQSSILVAIAAGLLAGTIRPRTTRTDTDTDTGTGTRTRTREDSPS
ncbi:MAG: AzlC family ABC transporter permease [Actinomycetota bacterium]